jgi:hypothetical protein
MAASIIHNLFRLFAQLFLLTTFSAGNLANANKLRQHIRFASKITAIIGFLPLWCSTPVLAKVNDPESLSRFAQGYEELQSLDRDWDKIVLNNGDNIRRRLGTVYTPPKCDKALCSFDSFISKFVKANMNELDFDAFEEPSRELLQALNQADFLAYSSIFSEYGNGGGGKDYIADSRTQIQKATKLMGTLVETINKVD